MFEIFRVRDNDNPQRGGRVIHSTASGDKARELQRKLHGQRPRGSSTWYGVRTAER